MSSSGIKPGPSGIPKAIIFDVDGTLYSQAKLRLLMVIEMAKFLTIRPRGLIDLKIVWNFRRIRYWKASRPETNLHDRQFIWGAQASEVTPEKVQQVVQEWMFERPLAYLRSCRYPGAQALFSQLQRQYIPIGIFSDYPAQEKLRALGLTAQVVVSATCAEVNRLKPDPTGLLLAARQLHTPVPDCLFIGDQEAKDGECARQAGMPYMILASHQKSRQLDDIATWLKDAKQS